MQDPLPAPVYTRERVLFLLRYWQQWHQTGHIPRGPLPFPDKPGDRRLSSPKGFDRFDVAAEYADLRAAIVRLEKIQCTVTEHLWRDGQSMDQVARRLGWRRDKVSRLAWAAVAMILTDLTGEAGSEAWLDHRRAGGKFGRTPV